MGAGSAEVPSKELPATLSLRLPALHRPTHYLIRGFFLKTFQNINLGQGPAPTEEKPGLKLSFRTSTYELLRSSRTLLHYNTVTRKQTL